MAMNKDAKALIRLAEKQGWRVAKARGGHFKWYSPNGAMITSGALDGDVRALRNHVALMRRVGGWTG